MQFRNTAIALILLVLIGGYAYYLARHPSTSRGQQLFKIAPKDIVQINLRYPNREIELATDLRHRWVLTKPLKADADQTAADEIARAIAELEVKKTVAEDTKDLSPFGLSHPRAIVTAVLKDGKKLPAIEVGKATPIGFSTYVKRADKPAVMVTSSTFGTQMIKNVDDLRDRQLLSTPADQANRVVIEHRPGETIELDKSGNEWQIVRPASYAADSSTVTSFLSTLTSGRISRFVNDSPANLAEYGLDQPQLSISLFTGKQQPAQSLAFGKQTGSASDRGYYVKRSDSQSVYTVPDWIFKEVDKPVNDFRDKTVLAFDPSKVGLLRIQNGGHKFTLKLGKNEKWQLEDGASAPADQGVVIQFLSYLRNLKGTSIVTEPLQDPRPFGLENPLEEVTLFDTSGKLLGWVKLGRMAEAAQQAGSTSSASGSTPPNYDYYASSSGTQAAFKIDNFSYEDLNKTADQFKLKPTATPSAHK
jgi:hypothetical protein